MTADSGTGTLRIRPGTPTDRDDLIALWQAAGLTRPWNDPARDIDRALAAGPHAAILVGEADGDGAQHPLVASVMAGFDGHRGWVYYLAVAPNRQGQGFGRAMLEAAERFLRLLGCPKLEVMLRPDNAAAAAFYRRCAYGEEDRRLMVKWLQKPPSAPPDPPATQPRPPIPVTTTWLAMTAPPADAGPVQGVQGHDDACSPVRLIRPTVGYYRYLHHSVGDPWLWWERRALTDARLAAIIHDDRVALHVLHRDGGPAGFIELDYRAMPGEAEIAYFGLLPEFIGQGLGPRLLAWGVAEAWRHVPPPGRLLVNTCTLDHPRALDGYRRAGFVEYAQKTRQITDPRDRGLIPDHVQILSPLPSQSP